MFCTGVKKGRREHNKPETCNLFPCGQNLVYIFKQTYKSGKINITLNDKMVSFIKKYCNTIVKTF